MPNAFGPASSNHKHGHSVGGKDSPTLMSWRSMKQRCTNPNNIGWADYGGRGVTVCARWLNSAAAFIEDMGVRPEGTTLDRYPNGAGNYEPGNCRWATKAEQNKNKRSSPGFKGTPKYGVKYDKNALHTPREKKAPTPKVSRGRQYTVGEVSGNLREVCAALGLNFNTTRARLERGGDEQGAFTRPVIK